MHSSRTSRFPLLDCKDSVPIKFHTCRRYKKNKFRIYIYVSSFAVSAKQHLHATVQMKLAIENERRKEKKRAEECIILMDCKLLLCALK